MRLPGIMMARVRRLGPGLLLAGSLAALLRVELPTRPESPAAPPAWPVPAGSPGPAPAPDLGAAVEAALARPLFAPGRRPPGRAPITPRPTSPPPKLTGVIVGPADRLAVFVASDGDRSVLVREGDQIGAMVVERIRPGEVVLRDADGSVTWRTGAGTATSTPVLDVSASATEQRLHTRGNEDQHAE